jgi:IS30 family transposase
MGLATCFTRPYTSQYKGIKENRIGVLRRFLPKKTTFGTNDRGNQIKTCR